MQDVTTWLPTFLVSAENDRELMNYFVKTRYISDITSTNRWMVLGRKGTGKTAIYEYLTKAPPSEIANYNVITLNFKDYPWPYHKLYKDTMESRFSSYSQSWNYIIIIKYISRLIKIKEENNEPLSPDLIKVKNYINQIYGNPDPTIFEVIKAKLLRLDRLSLPNLNAGLVNMSGGEISFEEISDNVTLKNKLRQNASMLLEYFVKIFKENNDNHKLLIIIDRLDENWTPSELEEYKNILISLIHVCQDINNNNTHIKIVLFLRTDIYQSLHFNDWNKILQDSATELKWTETSLNDMFFVRIQKYKPQELILDVSEKTNSIFCDKVLRHRSTPFSYMLRETFYRPRDLIVFMNKIHDSHDSTIPGLYSKNDIYNAEALFSESMYNELIDEWKSQKPEIVDYLTIWV